MNPLTPFSPQSNCPYLLGAYLAINVIPDATLFVDGPDCAFFKAQFIHGRHDLQSTLLDAAGNHSIRFSWVDVDSIVVDRSDLLGAALRRLDTTAGTSVLMLAPMPMATLTGIQYDTLLKGLDPPLSKPIMELPGQSLSADWLHGYADVLSALALHLPLEQTDTDPDAVAIVGYFMDRNEEDHQGNIRELERMLAGLELSTASVWLSGRPVEHLQQVARAGTIISLPHGREAARILAGRTGANLVETSIPFGLPATIDWLTAVGQALNRSEQAGRFIDSQLRQLTPKLQWLIPKYLLDMRVIFVGDPHLFEPFTLFMEELGVTVSGLVAIARQEHLDPLPHSLQTRRIPAIFEPGPAAFDALCQDTRKTGGLDLTVGSDFFSAGDSEIPAVQLGFPSYYWHALYDAPYLGFAGAAFFVQRIVNTLMKS